jgi:glutathione S-transferase
MFMADNADVEKSEQPYQLYYFPIPGRAESSRVALSLANLSWKDNQIDGKEYMQMKRDGQLPWGLVPMLRTPDGNLSESSAILRYIGAMAGLVPSNSFQAAKVDEFLDGMEPFSRVLSGTFGIDDVEQRADARRAVFNAEGDGTKNLKLLQRKITESSTGWAASTDKMNIADIKIFTELFGLFSGNYDGIDKSILADYPGLLEYHDKVANEPRMVAHYANPLSDSLQWTYQPGAFADQL